MLETKITTAFGGFIGAVLLMIPPEAVAILGMEKVSFIGFLVLACTALGYWVYRLVEGQSASLTEQLKEVREQLDSLRLENAKLVACNDQLREQVASLQALNAEILNK